MEVAKVAKAAKESKQNAAPENAARANQGEATTESCLHTLRISQNYLSVA